MSPPGAATRVPCARTVRSPAGAATAPASSATAHDDRLSRYRSPGLTDPVVAIAAGEGATCVLVGPARRAAGATTPRVNWATARTTTGWPRWSSTVSRTPSASRPGCARQLSQLRGAGRWHCTLLGRQRQRPARYWRRDTEPCRCACQRPDQGRRHRGREFHSCALTANGLPFCWGFNGRGQVGNANLGNHFVPIFVGLDNVVTLAGGNSHTCGLRTDGTQWCWGGNLLGQLGSNSPDPQPLATLVGTSSPFQAVGIAGGFGTRARWCPMARPGAGVTTAPVSSATPPCRHRSSP